MKKLFSLALVLIMALSLAACGSTPSSSAPATSGASGSTAGSGEPVVAYFVGIMQGGAAWSAAQKGFEDACAELGWEGHYVAPTTPNDTTEMVQLTETALTNGANVLIGTYYSTDIFGDVVQPAFNDGVYVATTNCAMGPDYQNFWIGTDPGGMGVAQAKTLVDLVGEEETTVVYMQTQATAETQNSQFAAFEAYLADYDNITVWGQEYCDSNEVTAAEKIANLVKANPEINACVCADGNGALGVANYVDESGSADSFTAIGIDDSADILGYVTAGALDCTIAQDFYAMGYESCQMIKTLMDGGSVLFDNDSGTIIILPDDVASYAADKGITLG